MGYQLWTSPITGYRRRGTRLSEYHSLFEAAVKVGSIFEPLQSCSAAADAREMREVLARRDFDVAGVMVEQGSPVSGWVTATELTSGRVRDHAKPINEDHVIGNDQSIADLLTTLKQLPHVFVRANGAICGIVTRADINKPPVRVYLFGLISLLEMHLGFWVEKGHPNDAWQGEIKASRVDDARVEQRKQQADGANPALFDCIQFCDKRDLFLGSSELRGMLQIDSKKDARSALGRAEKLRNRLAHSQQNISEGGEWESLINVVGWVERFLKTSDDLVERKAAESAEPRATELWAYL